MHEGAQPWPLRCLRVKDSKKILILLVWVVTMSLKNRPLVSDELGSSINI